MVRNTTLALLVLMSTSLAVAQPAGRPEAQDQDELSSESSREPAPSPDEPAATDDTATDDTATDDAVRQLRIEVAELREQNQRLREDVAFHEQRLSGLVQVAERVTGYVDVGFFVVQGDGSGIRPDLGHRYFPEYEDVVPASWVFMGDPLSTAINSRGEPADTGDSRALQSDSINAGNQPSFVVNTVSVSLYHGLGPRLAAEATLDFAPRRRDLAEPGGVYLSQFFEVPRAYVEYIAPTSSFDLHVYAGKFDAVLGYEYRVQEAPTRLTVTPSLICRYICGHPVGIKARALLLQRALVVSAAITNGSHFSERFPFRDELDSNRLKTAAMRLSYELPVGAGLELGLSGAIGAQDAQADDGILHWHVGADLSLDWNHLLLVAEYVQGNAPGKTDPGSPPCNVVPCLDYRGAYGQLGYRFRGGLIPYARVDWRDALHQHGASFVYISELARLTAGVRKEIGPYAVVKTEYTLNRELGRIPQAKNDIFTSSLVVKY